MSDSRTDFAEEQAGDTGMALAIYILYLVGLVFGITFLVGVIMAYVNRGAVKVGLLETSECPRTMERFPGLVAPAYVLFYQGRKLFHRAGLHQAEDLQELIDSTLAREGF